MSVFTPVSAAEARALLGHYSLGELERLEGIAQGVENTNYFLTTTTGEYVLTLFEHIPRSDLPFYVGLMDHVARVDYDAALDNWRGRAWRESFAQAVAPKLSREENALIDAENRYQAIHD